MAGKQIVVLLGASQAGKDTASRYLPLIRLQCLLHLEIMMFFHREHFSRIHT